MQSVDRDGFRGSLPPIRAARVLILAAAVLVACNGDDGGDARASTTTTEAPTTTSTTASTTTTTQPAATDLAVVQPLIEALVQENDELVVQLQQDPAVVDDPGNELVQRYRELYTPDSLHPDAYFQGLRDRAIAGTAVRAGPSGIAQQTTVVDLLPGGNADIVFFSFCGYGDLEAYVVATGEVREAWSVYALGRGEARRVDGRWRLFNVEAGVSETRPPGSPNGCEVAGQ